MIGLSFSDGVLIFLICCGIVGSIKIIGEKGRRGPITPKEFNDALKPTEWKIRYRCPGCFTIINSKHEHIKRNDVCTRCGLITLSGNLIETAVRKVRDKTKLPQPFGHCGLAFPSVEQERLGNAIFPSSEFLTEYKKLTGEQK